jgi:hypothetical protein
VDFFLGDRFLHPSGRAYGFLWCTRHHPNGTKMLLKVGFDKTGFGKFNISNNFKHNNDESHSKQPNIYRKIHTSLWVLEISKKPQTNSLETFAKCL